MQTAPARGRLTKEKSDVRDNVFSSKSLSCPQQKSHAAQRLNRLTAKLDALAVWRDDLLERIAVAEEKLHADGNLYFSRLYPDELDDLIDATRAWRIAAARVALDLENAEQHLCVSVRRM